LRTRSWVITSILALIDACVLVLALWLTWAFWMWWNPQLETIVQVRFRELFLPNPWLPPATVLIAAWILTIRLKGLYDPGRQERSIQVLAGLFPTAVYVTVLVMAFQTLFSSRHFSRLLMAGFVLLGFLSLSLVRILILRIQVHLPLTMAPQSVVIFGVGGDALLMADRLKSHGRHAFRLAGYLRPAADHVVRVPEDQVLGGVEVLQRAVNEQNVGIVILATRRVPREEAMKLATRCEHMGLRILQMPFTWGFASPKLSFASIGGLDLIDLQYLSYPSFVEYLKRVSDIFMVMLGGLVISPLLVATAILIKIDSPGPIFYVSPRLGKGGRIFPFFKFRSMVDKAREIQSGLQRRNEADGFLFKIREDPRVTRVGRLIRKYSIDELPQIWNVLRGDMNVIGPRPLPADDLRGIENDPEALYWFELRSKVNPGITGLWQVLGRGTNSFADMVAFDIHYIQNWSLWLDLQILLKTGPAVFRGRGAA
jgi:exopolysaccharide biosynthesis polyprenyl glycosylphosphotransferase